MSLLPTAEPVPLTTDADGIMRVGSTRVTLDTIVAAFHEGMTAEGIVEQYPSLQLGEVYFVLGYYLRHRADVDEYLRQRQQSAAEVRRENESHFEPTSVRE